MPDTQIVPCQPVAGAEPGVTVTVDSTYAAWLIEEGLATPVGGNAGGHDGAMNTAVAAAGDVTLAEVRGAPGSESDLTGLDPVAKVEATGTVDSRTVVKT